MILERGLKCYEDLGDEVIITGKDWPIEFSWEQIGNYFHEGFEKATSDWVIRMDQIIFFMKGLIKIRTFLKTIPHL